MAERRPLIAGNWKMHKTAAAARDFVAGLRERLDLGATTAEVGVCAPFTSLAATVEAARGSGIAVFAQNMHEQASGAFTGEVSAEMLLEIGVDGVVLGHSERRTYFHETDRALEEKLPVALEAGLRPILCVGESEEERDAGDTERRLRHQIQEAIRKVADERLGSLVVAYEPIWAIGTGRVATGEQVQDAIAFIRALVSDRSADAAEAVRILYGGSVNAENGAEILALEDVDGALVGGASLDIEQFAAIVDLAG